ncbi:MAG: TlpA family protein disulfide reductase [Ktedonobacteraceae bacterium]
MAELAEAGNPPVQEPMQKNKRRRKILIFSMVSLLNVTLLVLLLTQLLTPASTPVADPLVSHPAPDFSLAMLLHNSKNTLSLSNFKGKPIVLNFWASWCAPCKEEVPLLESTWKHMQTQRKDVVFLGIDFQDSSDNALSFLQQNSITYSNVLDVSGSVASTYGVTALPQTIFINRHGIVISRVARELTNQTLASNLQLIL